MKMFLQKNFLLALLVCPLIGAAQVIDSFNDGEFLNNPTWVGKTDSFYVDNGWLRSSGPQASSKIYLSTANGLMDSTEWNFLLKLDFNPSSTNYVRVYLVSDQQNLTGGLSGYFVQFGEAGTAPDSLDIFRQDGSTVTKVFTGMSGCMASSASNSVRVKIVRHGGGTWEVFADCTGGNTLNPEGSFTDNNITASSWFGVYCSYSTASRYNLYYLDDVEIKHIQPDVTKPTVLSAEVSSSSAIDVRFSEPVELSTAQTASHYSVNNLIGNPVTVQRDAVDLSLVHLTLSTPLQSGTNYLLSIADVTDLTGNMMDPISVPLAFFIASTYDILINEFMADPDPVVGIPAIEYVELYNRSAFPVSLNGWKFSDATSTVTISNATILPDSFIVLCSIANLDSLPSDITKAGLTSLPSLNNTSDNLSLKDNDGKLIHYVAYDDTWYQDIAKAGGGWSLELVDINNPCSGKENWKASVDPRGGTPGTTNSVIATNPDISLPQLLRAALVDENTLLLYFNESIDNGIAANPLSYSVNNGVGSPSLALPVPFGFSTVQLEFLQNFSRGTIYTVKVSGLADCSGNPIGMSDTARFAIPDSISPGDIVINEILFNPRTSGFDFLELYNQSNKAIDLVQLDILEMDINNLSQVSEMSGASNVNFLLFPHEYVVLTGNRDNILQNYSVENPTQLINVPLPNYPDDEGICVLKVRNGFTIDSLHYNKNWHYALLDDQNGVSLERIDYAKSTQDKNNWHSAASTAGFATPTFANSQYSETGISENAVSVNPEVFTPDNDGEKDFTFIQYAFDEPGYSCSIRIYDAVGREIRSLVKHETLGSMGQFQWDGTDDEQNKARVGIYLVFVEIFNLDGKVKRFKKQVVLGARLN